MESRQYAGIDIAKFVASLFVVAVHVPLLSPQFSGTYLLDNVLCRWAVPFFVATSTFLLAKNGEITRFAVQKMTVRVAVLYALWSTFYLPYVLIDLGQADASMLRKVLRLGRLVVQHGTYYHLWFFPALLLALWLLYLLLRCCSLRTATLIAFVLFCLGALGDSYESLALQWPPLASVYAAYFKVFFVTRNGLFLVLPFAVIGVLCRQASLSPRASAAGVVFSFLALIAEGVLVHVTESSRFGGGNFYFSLLPLTFFLVPWLLTWELAPSPWYKRLRAASILIYGCHVAAHLTIVRNGPAFVTSSFPLTFLATVALALAFTCVFLWAESLPHMKWLKYWY